jgi:glutamyl-tRNA reductase
MHRFVLDSFFVVGINYRKTDTALRGQFAVSGEGYDNILTKAGEYGVSELMVLSTCNRTEIYGFAEEAGALIELLCSETEGSPEIFLSQAYIKNSIEAISHLFRVAAGLDSQILGDYEIVGQLKLSAKKAKQADKLGPYLERMVNAVLQSTKRIRTETELSGGSVSVSFTAVQYAKTFSGDLDNRNVLLIGTGKIGKNTCKNLIDYLPGSKVTLINRTNATAETLSKSFRVGYLPYAELENAVATSGIVIVATGAPAEIITREMISHDAKKLFIDLSIPCNVAKDITTIDGVSLMDVDSLAKLKDETLRKRVGEVPRAENIIRETIDGFLEWHEMRRHAPVLQTVKKQLQEIQAYSNNTAQSCPEQRMQKVIRGIASHMKSEVPSGCFYLEALHGFLAGSIN